MRCAWACLLLISAGSYSLAQESVVEVTAAEAWRDSGKDATVCGQVIDSSYATSVPNASTYLYLERPRPEQVFTVIIPFAKRDLFGDDPEKSFRGKSVCVTGKIGADTLDGAVDRKHRATVVITEEEQLVVR